MKTYTETNQFKADSGDIYLQVRKLEFEQAAIRLAGHHPADAKCKQHSSMEATGRYVRHTVAFEIISNTV